MKKNEIRFVYLKEKLIPPKFRKIGFRKLMKLYREHEVVKLVFIDPWWYLPYRIIGILLWIPGLDRFIGWVQSLLVKKSKSIVVVV